PGRHGRYVWPAVFVPLTHTYRAPSREYTRKVWVSNTGDCRPSRTGLGLKVGPLQYSNSSTEALRVAQRPSRVNLTVPPTSTVSGRPRAVQPANGQLRLLERNLSGSIVQSTRGSMMVTSATASGLSVPRSMPRMFAELIVSFSMSCGQLSTSFSISAVTHT